MNLKIFLVSLMTTFLLSSAVSSAYYGPRLYLTESVEADFDTDGSYSSDTFSPCTTNPCRSGNLKADLPNDDDVLQSVNVTLAGYSSYTDINSDYAFKNFLSSPTAFSPTQIVQVNSSDLGSDDWYDYYNITDSDQAPVIMLATGYSNNAGGRDLYDDDNVGGSTNTLVINLTITNPSTAKSLSSVEVIVQFDWDTNGGNDAVNITDVYSLNASGDSQGTPTTANTDGDGYIDQASWSGNLGTSGGDNAVINLTMVVETADNEHYAEDTDQMNLDTLRTSDEGANATWSSTGSLFSSISVSAKSSRGPVRQGVDLTESGGYWLVRGFIRNMGDAAGVGEYNLTYNLTEWRTYEIDPSSGAPYSDPNVTGWFNQTATSSYFTPDDGRLYSTDKDRSSNTSWHNTGSTSKPFFTLYFDWGVEWNDTQSEFNYSRINVTLDLPTLYKIDMTAIQDAITGAINPDTGGDEVTLSYNSTHVGSTNAKAEFIRIYSAIPANATNGNFDGPFEINLSSIKVYYRNDTSTYTLDDDGVNLNITYINVSSDGSYNGSVNITIYDLSLVEIGGNAIGRSLDVNEEIRLVYSVLSNESMTTGDRYYFTGNCTMITDTGTPLTEDFNNQYIDVSARRLTGYKDIIAYDPTIPTLVNSTISVTVADSTGNGIPGIKFMDYVPNGSISYSDYIGNVSVRFYNGSWHDWTFGAGYYIYDNGTVQLSDGKYAHAFEFVNGTNNGTWNLSNGEIIEVSYQVNITTPGVWILPAEIAAFDPATGETFYAIAYGMIKISVPEFLTPLQITEEDLSLAKTVVVGKPAIWTKTFEVFNPNPKPVRSRFETAVFSDALEAYASYYDESGARVEEAVSLIQAAGGERTMLWESVINALETRSYEVRVLTPPVMEIDRDVEVLEQIDSKMVKLKLDIYLKSFAKEEYQNVVLNLPISYENIFEVRDAFGERMEFSGGRDSVSVRIPLIESEGMKTVSVIYKESYPTIIITPDRDRYNLTSPVNLEILVINGGDRVDYPYLEVEIYTPGMDIIYSNFEQLKDLEPLEKTSVYEKFIIPANAPTGNYLASARFREDFVTLASTTGKFYVAGIVGAGGPGMEMLMIALAVLVLVYLTYSRIKGIRRRPYSYGH